MTERPTGRPSMLNPDLIDTICEEAQEDGIPDAYLAAMFGVAKGTFQNWLSRGRGILAAYDAGDVPENYTEHEQLTALLAQRLDRARSLYLKGLLNALKDEKGKLTERAGLHILQSLYAAYSPRQTIDAKVETRNVSPDTIQSELDDILGKPEKLPHPGDVDAYDILIG